MKTLQKISDTINKIVSYVGMVIFIVLIIACVAQVFFRFVLNHSLSWTEELARFMFIWMHLLGASLLIQGRGHATVTVILDLLHGTVRKIVDVLIELVIFFDGTVMLYAGTELPGQQEHGTLGPHVDDQLFRGRGRPSPDDPGPGRHCADSVKYQCEGG